MKLEEKFRENLLGQLSDEKTEVDVNIACKIAREFTISFFTFFAENCFEIFDSKLYHIRDSEKYQDGYTIKQLLEIYETEYINHSL